MVDRTRYPSKGVLDHSTCSNNTTTSPLHQADTHQRLTHLNHQHTITNSHSSRPTHTPTLTLRINSSSSSDIIPSPRIRSITAEG